MAGVIVIPYQAEHVERLVEQKAMAYLRKYVSPETQKALEQPGRAFSLVNGVGRLIVCMGVCEYWPGRGEAWAILDQDCKKDFLAVHNAGKRFLDICAVARIEALVDVGFEPGHRWVKALGFEMEAPLLRKYRPNGGDCALYARIR